MTTRPVAGRPWARRTAAVLVLVAPPVLVAMGWLPPAACAGSVAVGLWLLLLALRSQAVPVVLVFVATAAVLTVVRQPWPNLTSGSATLEAAELQAMWTSAGPFDERLPVVLHIVLDELMSPGAVDQTLPGAHAYIDAAHALARRHGLRLFDAVYARYFFSGVSIPNMMNAEYLGRHLPSQVSTAVLEYVPENAYFRDMSARGYRTVVFQTAVLELCPPAEVRHCETYPSYDPAAGASAARDSRTQPVYLWDTLLRAYEPSVTSELGLWWIRSRYALDQHGVGVLGTTDRFDVQGFSRWFETFGQVVAAAPRGAHLVGHFLAPHSPYLLTDECVVSGQVDSGYYLETRFPDAAARDEARRRYHEAYFRQARCVLSKLDQLLTAIESRAAFDEALIVIHGDHGSRISSGNIAGQLTPRDLLDNYATFVAARGPRLTAGVDCTMTSLPQVFRELMTTGRAPTAPPAPWPVLAVVRDGDDTRAALSMPPFGCGA